MDQQLVGVSVIIPVLNGERTIGRQLGALARQETELKWEVLVADNGSTDGTRELVERFSQDFPVRLTLVDARARRSAAYARNCGARASSGAVLAFCDADDQVDVRWVQAAYEASLTAPVSTGLIRYLTEPFDPESEIFNPRILHGRGIFGANFVARREVFFEVGGFDESLPPYGCEDGEFSVRVLKSGRVISPAPDMVMYFQPTDDPRQKARKIFNSGIAESVVWDRHPDQYASMHSTQRILSRLVRFPLDALRMVRSTGSVPKEWLARQAVVRAGNAYGHLALVKRGHQRTAQLVGVDPLSTR